MLVLLALGVMNLPATIAVAVIIAVEKAWRFGEAFAQRAAAPPPPAGRASHVRVPPA